MEKSYYLYILQLESNKIYIGITTNVSRRYKQHLSGKGASFTMLYKPVKLASKQYIGIMTREEAEIYEDAKTLEYISRYGIEFVRGGHFFSTTETDKSFRRKYRMIDDKYKNIQMNEPIIHDIKKIKRKSKANKYNKQIAAARNQLNNSSRLLGVYR